MSFGYVFWGLFSIFENTDFSWRLKSINSYDLKQQKTLVFFNLTRKIVNIGIVY